MSGILVVDDRPIIAKACGLVLEPIGIEKIVSAFDVDTGYQAFLEHEPEVSVIDLSLDGKALDGLRLIRRIHLHDPDARILAFSMHAASAVLVSALEAGALGYLIKDSPTDELKTAVQQVRLGRRYVDSQLMRKLVFPNAALVPREKEVLALLMQSTPYETIAGQLGIRPKTVADLARRARCKLGNDHVQALIRLREVQSGASPQADKNAPASQPSIGQP